MSIREKVNSILLIKLKAPAQNDKVTPIVGGLRRGDFGGEAVKLYKESALYLGGWSDPFVSA